MQYLVKEVEEARGRKVVSEHEGSFVTSTTNAVGGEATTAEVRVEIIIIIGLKSYIFVFLIIIQLINLTAICK